MEALLSFPKWQQGLSETLLFLRVLHIHFLHNEDTCHPLEKSLIRASTVKRLIIPTMRVFEFRLSLWSDSAVCLPR